MSRFSKTSEQSSLLPGDMFSNFLISLRKSVLRINLMMLFMIFVFTLNIQSINAKTERKNLSRDLLDLLTKGSLKGKAWNLLEQVCDDYGHRMSGSDELEKVLRLIEKQAEKDGFENVHTEKVPGIPNFWRGNDEVTVLAPRKVSLRVLAIPGTPAGTVEADVVVVTSEEEFYSTEVKGKIVVIVPNWTNYTTVVRARYSASYVQKKGGVGMLVKSITPFSLGTLHTGRGYSIYNVTIPSASLTLEDAEMLLRWNKRQKKITIKMEIESRTLEKDLTSNNLIFDIKGSEFPDQIVLISGHLDTWDVGQGALNNGGGCMSVYYGMKAILDLIQKDSKYRPRRTVRGVLWTGGEQGGLGGKQYFKTHWQNKTLKEEFFLVSEINEGPFKPKNYNSTLNFIGSEKQMEYIKLVADTLNNYGIPISVRSLKKQGDDVQPFVAAGVPGVGYTSDRGHDWYYNFQNSNADYLNALEKEDLDYVSGIYGVLASVIANIDDWSSLN